MPSRPARHRNSARCLDLFPNPPSDLVGFGDDTVLVHGEDFSIAHDELAVDHDGLDVGWLTVVDPRRHDAARRHEVRALSVEDDEIRLPADFERTEELFLTHGSRASLRGILEHVFRLRPGAWDR